MKKLLILIVGSALVSASTRAAVQALPFTDHFSYSAGNLPAVTIDVGLPYNGPAPDLGAYEFGP